MFLGGTPKLRWLKLSALLMPVLPVLVLAGCRSTALQGVPKRSSNASLLNEHADRHSLITSENVGRFKLAWTIRNPNPITASPLISQGRVYYADWGGVVSAADAGTGRTLWLSEVEKPRRERPWHGYCSTGVLAGGKLFEASAEGRAFAFDAANGKLLWQQRFTFHSDAGCRGNLLYHDGLLYVPVSTVETPTNKSASASFFRGSVVALDARDGRRVWEQDLLSVGQMPGTGLVGVMVPGGFALDPETGLLFVTTGHIPGIGSTLLTDSILALDAKTGALRWSFSAPPLVASAQAPAAVSNSGFAAAPQLFQASIQGTLRPLIAAGDQRGRFWVLNRNSGSLVWSTVVTSDGSAERIVADASIVQGRVCLWSNRSVAGNAPPNPSMAIRALDAATGTILWSVPGAQAGGLRAAGFLARDVYLVGSLDGKVRAYRATDGQRLWTSPVTGPVGSSLIMVGNRLFFSTGVPPSQDGPSEGGGIFAFALAQVPSSGNVIQATKRPYGE